MGRLFVIVGLVYCVKAASCLLLPERAADFQYLNSTAANGSIPDDFCCEVFFPGVALNYWYNSSVEVDNEIVITEYLHYNNAIVPTATRTTFTNYPLHYGSYAADLVDFPFIPGVPTDLNGPHGQYDATVIHSDLSEQNIASPTPFMVYMSIVVFTGFVNEAGTCIGTSYSSNLVTVGTATSDSFTSYHQTATNTFEIPSAASSLFNIRAQDPFNPGQFEELDIYLTTPYLAVVSRTIGWTQNIVFTTIQPEQFSWLARDPNVVSQFPSIGRCRGSSAAGAPTVHVHATLLTTSSAETRMTNAIYTGTAAAPVSRTHSISSTTGKLSTVVRTSAPDTSSTSKLSTVSHSPSTYAKLQSSTSAISETFTTPTGDGQASSESLESLAPASISNADTTTQTHDKVSLAPADASASSSVDTSVKPNPSASSSVEVVVGSMTATATSSDASPIESVTISTGGSAMEISGTTYSAPTSSSNTVINGGTSPLSTTSDIATQTASIVIGDVTALSGSSGAYVTTNQPLNSGGSLVKISGTTYSLPASGNTVIVDGEPSSVAPVTASEKSSVLIGSATAVPLSSDLYVIEGQTLSAGGPAVEASGTMYSFPASSDVVLIDGMPTETISFATAAVLTVGSQTFTVTAASSGPLVIASQTIVPGGSGITLSGTVLSIPAVGTGVIVVNAQTTSFATAASCAPVLAVGSEKLTFTPLDSGVMIASQTLYPGGAAVTVSGELLSLSAEGTAVVVSSGSSSTTEGLGDYIWQGIAASTSSAVSSSTEVGTSSLSSETISASASVVTMKASSSTGTTLIGKGASETGISATSSMSSPTAGGGLSNKRPACRNVIAAAWMAAMCYL